MEYIKELEIPIDEFYRKIHIFVKQNDYNSRFFSVKLTANGAVLTSEAFGTVNEVAIGITRGDKQKKAFRGSYNPTAGTFTLPLPKWAVERAGDKITFDVMVIGTNANGEAYLLRSALVEVYVQAAGYGSEDASEDKSVEILTGLIADVVKLKQDVGTASAALDYKYDKTGGIIEGDVSIQGNLSVSGTATTKDTETLRVQDNVIVANANGVELIDLGGFAIKTDTTNVYGIMYDPVGDGVKIGLGSFDKNGKFTFLDGEAQFLATRADEIADGNLVQWDAEKRMFVDSGVSLASKADKTDLPEVLRW